MQKHWHRRTQGDWHTGLGGRGSLKTPAKHEENESQRDQRNRGTSGTKQTNEIPKTHRKTNESLPIPIRTHPRTTRDASSPRRTIFYTISQNKVKHQPKRARAPGALIELQSPSDRITHTGTIKISRSDSPANFRCIGKITNN
jgi:hypothetical protein